MDRPTVGRVDWRERASFRPQQFDRSGSRLRSHRLRAFDYARSLKYTVAHDPVVAAPAVCRRPRGIKANWRYSRKV